MLPSFISPEGTNPGFPAFIRLSFEQIAPTVFNLYAYLSFEGADSLRLQTSGPTLKTTLYLGTVSLSKAFAGSLEISAIAAILKLSQSAPALNIIEVAGSTLTINRMGSPKVAIASKIGASLALQSDSPQVALSSKLPSLKLTYAHPRAESSC
ncbi:MAG: hypothetical protein AAFO83_00250 [Cyanobacteria bacterium J06607_13]